MQLDLTRVAWVQSTYLPYPRIATTYGNPHIVIQYRGDAKQYRGYANQYRILVHQYADWYTNMAVLVYQYGGIGVPITGTVTNTAGIGVPITGTVTNTAGIAVPIPVLVYQRRSERACERRPGPHSEHGFPI